MASCMRAPCLPRGCIFLDSSHAQHQNRARFHNTSSALARVRFQGTSRTLRGLRCQAKQGDAEEKATDQDDLVMMEAVSDPVEAAAIESIEESVDEEPTMDWGEWDEDEMFESLGVDEMKRVLLDTFVGTDRGFSANSETRAEINELITQLEAANPTESPTASLDKLSGKWKLAYTSNSELVVFLAASTLPLLKIGDIMQNIDGESGTVVNQLEVITPLARGSITATAAIEVRSPKRLQVKFTEGTFSTPQLVSDLQLPNAFEFNGQKIDFSPLQGVADTVTQLLKPASEVLSRFPDLKLPLPDQDGSGQSWLLTTYLDDDLRIARGDAGSVFVLEKVIEV